MANEPKEPSPPADGEALVRFDYVKSPSFRTAHIDGVIGGPTPDGRKIYMALFSERAPIPTQVTHTMKRLGETDSMKLGDELMELRVSRDAVVRELEVGLVLDLAGAALVHQWLTDKLTILKKVTEQRVADSQGAVSPKDKK